ncbi:MAG: class II fructose-bisphosphate aldolase [Anaerolineae bacterium]|nr:class II fructose-bisphosphate aldolase [Anaerolineae bacterium]
MSLENTVQILYTACKAGYCVGAFNIVDYLSLEAVIHAAETHHAPVILQTSSTTVRRYGAERLVALTRTLADRTPIPIGLHLDHGTEFELIKECIKAGYSSVMIDASRYAFEENIARTHQVVELAHCYGVSVEGEIGVLAGVEDDLVVQHDKAIYTTPEEAIEFQARSEVDFLAVAVGTAHGFYKEEPRLDVETLREIHKRVSFPLVIHGGSGLSMQTLQTLVSAGAAKLNISTQLKKDYIDSLESYLSAHSNEYNPMRMLDNTHDQLVKTVGAYLQVLGSAGRV